MPVCKIPQTGEITLSRIAIVDADLLDTSRRNHRFPNLALMKLSGWHKAQGDEVTLILDWESVLPGQSLFQVDFDHTYIGKVFTETYVPPCWEEIPQMTYGGTGFFFDNSPKLPCEVEHHLPDYHLYDEWVASEKQSAEDRGVRMNAALKYYTDFSMGFATRGCIRRCPFCVNRNSRGVERHSFISEFLDPARPHINLNDDNILAFSGWREVFAELKATGKTWAFRQGMDFRFLTPEKAKAIAEAKYYGDYIFAFDNIADRKYIERNLQNIWKPYVKHSLNKTKFYVLVGYDRAKSGELYGEEFWIQDMKDAFERVRILFEYECYPYIMRYKEASSSPYPWFYIALAHWCNDVRMMTRMTFAEMFRKRKDWKKTQQVFEEFMLKDWFKDYAGMRFRPNHVIDESRRKKKPVE